MKRIFLLDPLNCTGCRSCEINCSFLKEGYFNPRLARIRVVKDDKEGKDTPIFCWQCGRAPCLAACPIDAIGRDIKTDAVIIDADKCNGCGQCIEKCPFGIIIQHPQTKKAIKCDLCGGEPKCVDFCPTNALYYSTPHQLIALRYSS